jgi:hypothetical protein
VARERILTKPVLVTVEKATAVAKSYDTVRFVGAIMFHVADNILKQQAVFSWAIGSVDVEGNFQPAPVNGLAGTKVYNNAAPNYDFSVLISKAPTLAAAQDQVFADLEAEGQIPAGTNRDYALYPPGYVPPGP